MQRGFIPGARLSYVVGIGMGGLALAAIWSLYNAFMPLLLAEYVSSRCCAASSWASTTLWPCC